MQFRYAFNVSFPGWQWKWFPILIIGFIAYMVTGKSGSDAIATMLFLVLLSFSSFSFTMDKKTMKIGKEIPDGVGYEFNFVDTPSATEDFLDTASSEDDDPRQSHIDAIESQIEDAEIELEDANDELESATDNLRDAQDEMDDAQREFERCTRERDAQQVEFDVAKTRRATMCERVEALKAELAKAKLPESSDASDSAKL